MRRILLSFSTLSLMATSTLSFSFLPATARAADAIDTSVKDFTLSRMTTSGDDWFADDLSEIKSRTQELNKKPKQTDLRDIRDKIDVEKAKLSLIREVRSDVTKKISKEKLREAITRALNPGGANAEQVAALDKEILRIEAESKVAQSKVTAAEESLKDSALSADDRKKIEDQKTQQTNIVANNKASMDEKKKSKESLAKDDSPIELDRGVMLRATVKKDANGKQTVKMSLELDKSRISSLPNEIRKHFKEEDDIKSYFDDYIGKDLYSKDYDEKKTPEQITKDIARDDVGNDIKADATNKIEAAREAIGTKEDSSSRLGKYQEELNEKLGVGRDSELKDLIVKKKIAEFLKRNPSAKEMESCDIILKAATWNELSAATKQECAEKDPNKTKREKDANAQMAAKDKKEHEEMQMARARELTELQQHCEALYRQKAAQDATAQVTGPINALMDKLVLQYNSSEMYAGLCAPQTSDGGDEFDRVAIDPKAEAARKVQQMLSEPEKLEKEREAVSLVMRRSIYSLERAGSMMGGALTANAQTGMLDMSQISMADAKVQRMGSIYNCAKDILDAIDAGKAMRRMDIDGQLNGSAQNGAVPVSGGVAVSPNSVNGTANGNRRMNNLNNSRPATIQKNRLLQNNRNNNNSGSAGSRNRADTPNYLGN